MSSDKKNLVFIVTFFLIAVFPFSAAGFASNTDTTRIHLVLDTSEADEVLKILALRQAGERIADAEWQKLFSTEPYRRLKDRQAKIAQLFHDSTLVLNEEKFKQFILSDDLLKRASELKVTLDRWKEANLEAAAEEPLAYLPDSANIRAKIYPVIKPQSNSFVWETATNPAIFLYLDPEVTSENFANTVAHELHHIGFSSINSGYDQKISSLPERAQTVAYWITAFGEGMAMLAAAGRPEIHPHSMSTEKERSRWDKDIADFNSNLESVDSFFVAILDGTISSQDSIEKRGSSFFGIQGPWYTVGYKMCVMVEKRFGRSVLIQTALDPRQLLVLYNRAAKEQNAGSGNTLPLWSENILKQIGAE